MIDIDNDELWTLKEAAKRFPSPRTGNPLAVATIYRWAKAGCDGVVLETIKVGKHVLTSREAVKRFVRHRTRGPIAGPGSPRSPERSARTNDILRQKGLGDVCDEKPDDAEAERDQDTED